MKISSIGLCILALTAAGCGTRHNNESQVKHAMDEPVALADTIQWSTITFEEFRKEVMGPESMMLEKPLPATAAQSKRVKAIVEAFDARLRRFFPEQMAKVPIPATAVVEYDEPNAFVPSRTLCFKIPASIEGATADSASVPWFRFEPNMNRVVGLDVGVPCQGKDMGSDTATLQEYIAVIQAQELRYGKGVIDCHISWTGKEVLFRGEECQPPGGGVGRAQAVSVPTSAALVVVTTALFNLLSENELKFVLAHELGHYYRAHVSAVESRAFYFYERQAPNQAGRPPRTENPDLMNLATRILDLASVPSRPAVPGELLARFLFGHLNALLMEPEGLPLSVLLRESTDSKVKAIWSSVGLDPEMRRACPEYRYRMAMGLPMADAAHERCYLADQKQLLAKADATRLPVTVSTENYGTRTLTAELIYSAVNVPIVAALSAREWALQHPETVGDVLRFISKRMVALSDEFRVREKEALSKRLGFYTIEQEADEWALEQMASFGIPLDTSVQALLKPALYAEKLGMIDPRDSVTPSMCKAAYEQNWKTMPEVPIGLWHDTHHSTCFRVYNLTQEMGAHRYLR